jgi:hypothetical protein
LQRKTDFHMVGDEISILRRKLVKSESLAIRDARRVRWRCTVGTSHYLKDPGRWFIPEAPGSSSER